MFLIASLGFYSNVDFAVDEQRYAKARLAMAFISLTSFIISILFKQATFDFFLNKFKKLG